MSVTDTAPRPTKPRWSVTIFYRTAAGITDVEHEIFELGELEDLVERGPHWDTISGIKIDRINPMQPKLTIEEAAKQ